MFGVPLGFAVIILVSLVTPAPSQQIQELVEHVRYPSLKGTAKSMMHGWHLKVNKAPATVAAPRAFFMPPRLRPGRLFHVSRCR